MLHSATYLSTQHIPDCFAQTSTIRPPKTSTKLGITSLPAKVQDIRGQMDPQILARHFQSFILDEESHSPKDDIKGTPLFSHKVLNAINNGSTEISTDDSESVLPQHGLIGIRQATYEGSAETAESQNIDNLVYANVDVHSSTLICGRHGGGRNHSLLCLLENAFQPNNNYGSLTKPPSGIIFHYNNFTRIDLHQYCEAANLCSKGIPVRVLVSPSNYVALKELYENLPGVGSSKPKVFPLYLSDQQLNLANIMTLMHIDQTSRDTPLHLQTVYCIMRETAMESEEPGFNYTSFKNRLDRQTFSRDQKFEIKIRLQLLEDFLSSQSSSNVATWADGGLSGVSPGTLTIVDLSDPFIDSGNACGLFKVCLSLFLENNNHDNRIVALNEAHRFLPLSDSSSNAALEFVDALADLVAKPRHLATQLILSTQEPPSCPQLRNIFDIAIVYGFYSPAWFNILRSHLTGDGVVDDNAEQVFNTIIGLRIGEALVFSPAATLDTADQGYESSKVKLVRLGAKYFRMMVRNRLSADGQTRIFPID